MEHTTYPQCLAEQVLAQLTVTPTGGATISGNDTTATALSGSRTPARTTTAQRERAARSPWPPVALVYWWTRPGSNR